MTGIHRLNQAASKYAEKKQDTKRTYSGLLGFIVGGVQVVSVPGRTGYVYVRLRDKPSEYLQAYNDAVSLTYDLPVLVSRDTTKNRYVIEGRDIGRYDNWGTSSSYISSHGHTHSFGSSDVVWVYERQFMPLLVTPSGSLGSNTVIVQQKAYFRNDTWIFVETSSTADILGYKPTDGTARMVLVYVDNSGNLQLSAGGYFASSNTGTADIIAYMPVFSGSAGVPLAGIRLVSGTSSILWDNIYDFRPLGV